MADSMPRRAGEPTTRRSGAVLIVDDDDNVRTALARTLRLSGFSVIESANGVAAMDRLQSPADVALVLLDLNMSEMDGRAFRQLQLADPRLSAIPTVVLTGAPLIEVDGLSLRADDYLLKPVGRDHLLSVVSAYCLPETP
jgi:CheY-like chemotaxis protein